jgi:hypothetical protein
MDHNIFKNMQLLFGQLLSKMLNNEAIVEIFFTYKFSGYN